MARDKNSVQFTPDHKLLCNEIDEVSGALEGKFPFDSNYNVYAVEFEESDDIDGVTYSNDKKIIAYEFEEDFEIIEITPPEVYALTFEPEIEYNMEYGFKITNLSTLLSDTGTTVDEWSVGLVTYHNATARKPEFRELHSRRKRTAWGYSLDFDGNMCEMVLDADGSISGTSYIAGRSTGCEAPFSGNVNDRKLNGDDFVPLFGIRLRYNKNTEYRTLYSSRFVKSIPDTDSFTYVNKITQGNYVTFDGVTFNV